MNEIVSKEQEGPCWIHQCSFMFKPFSIIGEVSELQYSFTGLS